jgi:class 3 adenylate cyclase
MDELRATLEEALSGRGRLVLLVGEPGIGKTRTAEEFTTYARLRKAQVLWGRCYEGEGAPAYWPWVQAIRSYVHDRDPKQLLSELGSAAPDIAQVVSEVRERLPGLVPPPPMSPEQARFRLFDGITTFLRNASRAEPLVLVLDDLHWADKPSLLLLQFLARELRGARLVVVGTYRDIELGRQHPLAQTLAELTREQRSQRVVLRGLNAQDVGRFIEITAGLKPPAALVATVYKETEGNPFFVNEVVRLLASDGRLTRPEQVTSWSVDIPQGVREVVTRRLDRLSAECNRVLTIGAVIGREFTFEVLERLVEYSSDRLLEVLEEATAARVVSEVPRTIGRYTFAHALIRETLVGELTTTRRVRLHRQIGEALEALYGSNPEPHLAELAYHFFEAAQGGDVDRAIAYCLRAGDRAALQMAHEQAVHHYEMGLQALELRDRSDPGRCALLLKLCEVLWRAGEYVRARQTALEAAALARAVGDGEFLARAALGYAGTLPAFAAVVRDDTLAGLLEEALATISPADSPLRARLLGRLAEETVFSDPLERRQALCAEAVGIARRLGDPSTLALVLRHAHWGTMVADNLAERLAITEEILRLAEAAGNVGVLAETHFLRFGAMLERGDIAAARRHFEASIVRGDQTHLPYYKWAKGMGHVLLAFAEGRLAEVEALVLQQAAALGEEAQHNALLVQGIQLLLLQRELGRLQEEEMLLASGAALFPSIAPALAIVTARMHCDLGREAEARPTFDALANADFATVPRDQAWLFSLAYLGEICAHLQDREAAAKLYARMASLADQFVTITPVLIFNPVHHYLGLLAATLARWSDAVAHFETSIAMTTRLGMTHGRAKTEVAYAEMLLRRDDPVDRGKALDLLNRALERAGRLGMRHVLERALALKLRAQGILAPGDFQTSIDAVATVVTQEQIDLRPHAAPDGTITILFSDIEGSTAMTERLGDQRWLDVLREHNRVVREHVAAHGGYEVKSQGDGFMIAFQSARRALQCAIAIQRAFELHAPADGLRVRIGLHVGEVVKEADDFFGKNVILAARIAAQAAGGEILVSALVKELTHSASDLRFAEPRRAELKGLSGEYVLHPVAWAAE